VVLTCVHCMWCSPVYIVCGAHLCTLYVVLTCVHCVWCSPVYVCMWLLVITVVRCQDHHDAVTVVTRLTRVPPSPSRSLNQSQSLAHQVTSTCHRCFDLFIWIFCNFLSKYVLPLVMGKSQIPNLMD